MINDSPSPTLANLLAVGHEALRKHTESPRLDAELLLLHATGRPRSHLYSHPEAPVSATERDRYFGLLQRRGRHEPLAYLTGNREFWSLPLAVSRHTLIPRPETETLVERALRRLPPDSVTRVLDLGTGSGAIALALARERPGCRVTAVDNSPDALAVARNNGQQLDLPVAWLLSDWYSAVSDQRFDLLVSNPPYVASGDPHLARGDVAHEPGSALIGGADGLDHLRRIIAESRSVLRPGGWLLVEHGFDQHLSVTGLFTLAGYLSVQTTPDLAGQPRVTEGQATD